MARKPKTIDNIMAKFTVKMLPFIEEDPNYEGINENM